MNRIKALTAWRPGRLAHNVAHVGAWNAIRIALQALNLVLLARVFGPEVYGALSGSVALFLTAAQFVGLGTGISLVRHVARGGESAAKLQSIQRIYALSGISIFAFAWIASTWLFGRYLPTNVLLMLAAADIVLMPLIVPLACYFQAKERLGMTSALLTLASIVRCVTILILLIAGVRSIALYAGLYLVGMAMCVTLILFRLWPKGRVGPVTLPRMIDEVREGIRYAVGSATVTASNELDKSLMLRMAGELATGHYAAASRIAQAGIMPVQALLVAISPRWFREHISETPNRNLILTLAIAGTYALGAAFACWIASPLLPFVLGKSFEPSVALLQLMSAAILSGSLRTTIMTIAMTRDLQTSRNLIELSCLILSLLLMALLIPQYGGVGAVISIVASDAAAISMGATILVVTERRRRK